MATKVKAKNLKELVEVPGGRYLEIKGDVKGFKDGDTVVAFRNDELCDFEVAYPEGHKGVQHVEAKTVITMHILDAAIAHVMGKGKIIKVYPLKERGKK